MTNASIQVYEYSRSGSPTPVAPVKSDRCEVPHEFRPYNPEEDRSFLYRSYMQSLW